MPDGLEGAYIRIAAQAMSDEQDKEFSLAALRLMGEEIPEDLQRWDDARQRNAYQVWFKGYLDFLDRV